MEAGPGLSSEIRYRRNRWSGFFHLRPDGGWPSSTAAWPDLTRARTFGVRWYFAIWSRGRTRGALESAGRSSALWRLAYGIWLRQAERLLSLRRMAYGSWTGPGRNFAVLPRRFCPVRSAILHRPRQVRCLRLPAAICG